MNWKVVTDFLTNQADAHGKNRATGTECESGCIPCAATKFYERVSKQFEAISSIDASLKRIADTLERIEQERSTRA